MHPHKVKEFAEAEEVVEGVRQSMLRQGSVLRLIGIGFVIYRVRVPCPNISLGPVLTDTMLVQGRWAYKKAEDGTSTVEFEIVSNVVDGSTYGIGP